MHERALMRDVMSRIEELARVEGASRVTRVDVQLGALSHFTPDHFREHFEDASRTVAADRTDVHAAEVLVESVEVEV
jgi:hydrogenase nickel incorporation protein HypA/HybF